MRSINDAGDFIAFASFASDLGPIANDNGTTFADIFLHEVGVGSTTITKNINDEETNGTSSSPSIIDDGRFIAFASTASDLVTGDTNGESDIFVFDRTSGSIARVSVNQNGGQANGPSSSPDISSDGRVIAFVSDADNLVAGDINGRLDVFVAANPLAP